MVSAVRLIQPAEAEHVRQLLQEAARWSRAFGPPIWREEELARCVDVACPCDRCWLGAFDQGRLVACMRIDTADPVHWPDDPPGDAVYIHKLAVARQDAGLGWPGRLVEVATGFAAALGARYLRLDTLPREKLIRIYRRSGFQLVDQHPRLFADRELVRMERDLSRSPFTAPADAIQQREQ